jgi:hypothetical protein
MTNKWEHQYNIKDLFFIDSRRHKFVSNYKSNKWWVANEKHEG